MADSLRVSDDYGKFRFQLEQRTTYFGIKGSFIVVNNRVARQIGFDHGLKSSITEDAYFAIKAKSQNIKFGFIPASIKERSPFTILDFVRQRRRWFGGLWYLVCDGSLSFKTKFPLSIMMISWGLSPLSLIPIFTSATIPTVSPFSLVIIFGVFFGTYIWTYLFGFFHNFDLSCKTVLLFLPLQIILIPVFSLMEISGVIYGALCPPKSFHIVDKRIAPTTTTIRVAQSPTTPNNASVSPHTVLTIETDTTTANGILYASPTNTQSQNHIL